MSQLTVTHPSAKVSKTQYQYTLQDPDVAELFKWAPIVLAQLSALPELQDVTGDLQASAPRMMLKIDRDVLGRLGITPQSPRICSLTCRRRAARCRQE